MGLLTELFHQTANRKEYLGQEEVGFWGRWNYLRKRLSMTGNGGQFATAKRGAGNFPVASSSPRVALPLWDDRRGVAADLDHLGCRVRIGRTCHTVGGRVSLSDTQW